MALLKIFADMVVIITKSEWRMMTALKFAGTSACLHYLVHLHPLPTRHNIIRCIAQPTKHWQELKVKSSNKSQKPQWWVDFWIHRKSDFQTDFDSGISLTS